MSEIEDQDSKPFAPVGVQILAVTVGVAALLLLAHLFFPGGRNIDDARAVYHVTCFSGGTQIMEAVTTATPSFDDGFLRWRDNTGRHAIHADCVVEEPK